MLDIRPCGILTFLYELSGQLPFAATFYAGRLSGQGESVGLYGAYHDGVPCAFAAMRVLRKENAALLEYVVVVEKYRSQGIGRRLIEHCVQCAERSGVREIRCRLTHEEGEDVPPASSLRELGFSVEKSSVTVLIENSRRTTVEWFTFLRHRGNRLIRRILRDGLTVMTYTEAGSDVLRMLSEQVGSRFPREIEAVTPRLEILNDYSYVTLKSGIPVAYCQLVTADSGKNVIVQGMASAAEYIGHGVFFPCLAGVISDLLTLTAAAKTAFTFYSKNNEMKGMLGTFLNFTDKTLKYQDFYLLRFMRREA